MLCNLFSFFLLWESSRALLFFATFFTVNAVDVIVSLSSLTQIVFFIRPRFGFTLDCRLKWERRGEKGKYEKIAKQKFRDYETLTKSDVLFSRFPVALLRTRRRKYGFSLRRRRLLSSGSRDGERNERNRTLLIDKTEQNDTLKSSTLLWDNGGAKEER